MRPAASHVVASPPQYVLVAQRLIDDIQGGRYPVGSLLPTEFDLCTQFGVSRHTVREAIRRLQERGLVTRQRGVGTTVKANRAESRYVQSSAAISDLPQYVEDTRLVTTEAADLIADAALAELLKCPAGQRWVKVTGFRYAGREKLPMALTDIYINAAYGGVRKLIGTMKVPVYTLLEKQYGITIVEVEQEIRATTMGAADAKRLKVKPGSAGLLVTRRYLGDNDRLIEVSVNLHPAERFSYSMSLRLPVPAGVDA
jgi:GntR family transcriptional regulator